MKPTMKETVDKIANLHADEHNYKLKIQDVIQKLVDCELETFEQASEDLTTAYLSGYSKGKESSEKAIAVAVEALEDMHPARIYDNAWPIAEKALEEINKLKVGRNETCKSH